MHRRLIGRKAAQLPSLYVADIRKDREATKDKGRMLVRETYEGSVSGSFSLPQDIDEAHVSAKLDNGVLQLALPKREGSRNRRIAVE